MVIMILDIASRMMKIEKSLDKGMLYAMKSYFTSTYLLWNLKMQVKKLINMYRLSWRKFQKMMH